MSVGSAKKPFSGTTRERGESAEDAALAYLEGAGMRLLHRNYRTPGRGGGEIDLIMRGEGGTLVFIEVRARARAGFGGAAASVSYTKQRRIIFAAYHYLRRFRAPPPCRFDVVAIEAGHIEWIPGAFDAG